MQSLNGHLFCLVYHNGTVLGPLLFSLHINDILDERDSEIRLFSDDCVYYRQIHSIEEAVKLQSDIDHLG